MLCYTLKASHLLVSMAELVDLQLQCLVYSDAVMHVSNVVFYDMLCMRSMDVQ